MTRGAPRLDRGKRRILVLPGLQDHHGGNGSVEISMTPVSQRRDIPHRPQLVMQLPCQCARHEIWMGSGRAPTGGSNKIE